MVLGSDCINISARYKVVWQTGRISNPSEKAIRIGAPIGGSMTWTLVADSFGAFAVRPCLLDLQFHVAIASKRSTFLAVPRGRNLNQGRFGFQSHADMGVNLGPKALSDRCIMWNLGKLQVITAGSTLPHSQSGKYAFWTQAPFVC